MRDVCVRTRWDRVEEGKEDTGRIAVSDEKAREYGKTKDVSKAE